MAELRYPKNPQNYNYFGRLKIKNQLCQSSNLTFCYILTTNFYFLEHITFLSPLIDTVQGNNMFGL